MLRGRHRRRVQARALLATSALLVPLTPFWERRQPSPQVVWRYSVGTLPSTVRKDRPPPPPPLRATTVPQTP